MHKFKCNGCGATWEQSRGEFEDSPLLFRGHTGCPKDGIWEREEDLPNRHRACLTLPRSRQAVRNWRKTLERELARAAALPSVRLPKNTWARVAEVASMLAHYGRCVQIRKGGKHAGGN